MSLERFFNYRFLFNEITERPVDWIHEFYNMYANLTEVERTSCATGHQKEVFATTSRIRQLAESVDRSISRACRIAYDDHRCEDWINQDVLRLKLNSEIKSFFMVVMSEVLHMV